MNDPLSAVFVDTSVQIARVIGSPELKEWIERRLGRYARVVSGLVVRQEFKRRLLKEAKYLLEKLDETKTVVRLRRHLIDHLPRQLERKRNICLTLLQTIDEQDNEGDHADRLRSFLHALLRDGMDEEFDSRVNEVVHDSGCACAVRRVQRTGPNRDRYEFGTDQCSKSDEPCGVVAFLVGHRELTRAILGRLQELTGDAKTSELANAERFLLRVLEEPSGAERLDPCLKVGDLLIALESVGVPHFYTLNRRESEHLCPVLGQVLIVRPKNDAYDDEVIPPAEAT
jgi:hypothetical protein